MWFLFTCIFSNQSFSQTTADVRYSFEHDSVQVNVGHTFANKFLIENLTDRSISLTPHANQTAALSGMIALPNSITLNPREKKSYPLKYIADRKTIINSLQSFTISLQSSDTQLKIQPAISFYTLLGDVAGLEISTDQSEFYLNQATGQTQVMLLCTNRGIVPISFRLLLSEVPEGLEFVGERMSMVLQPGAQQLLPFRARNKLNIKIAADFNVTIQALDQGGNQLALKRIRIMSVSSIRRYGAGDNPFNKNLNNTVALRYVSMNENNSIYQLQANGKLDLNKNSDLQYRFNMDYYKELNGINLYDSYLDYQHKDWGVKVGNIYENLDFAMSGRGVKASINIKEDKSINVYAMQNNYLLLSQVNTIIEGSDIIAANYAFKTIGNQDGRLTYLHSQNNFFGLSNNQLSGKTAIRISENQQIDLEGGYSFEKAEKKTGMHAMAIGFNYSVSAGGIQFSTNNYYSSPYYTGLRRGLLQLESRLNKKIDNTTLSARVSLMNNTPKYQDTRNRYFFNGNKNSIHIYELGYSIILGKLNLEFRPYFMDQKLEGMHYVDQSNRGFQWRSSSFRTQANLNFYNKNHNFSLNTDYGYTFINTSNEPSTPFTSFRMNGNYSNRLFGVTSYIQLNPYYLSDTFSSSKNSSYKMYSFGPNTNFNLLDNKLNIFMAGMYNYYGFTGSRNYSINSTARWLLKGNWALTADVFYTIMDTKTPVAYYQANTTYSNYSNTFNTRQIRVGIEKQFSGLNKNTGKKLELSYYEDHNNNSMRDAGERGAEGITVKLNQETAQTNANGTVKFYDVKTGNYTIYIINSKNWGMQEPISILVSKNKSMEIPLVKTISLRGKMLVSAKSYNNTHPILSGIRINAKDANGRIFTTLTDAAGNYSYYLPSGIYNVYIETDGMAFSIKNADNKIELSAAKLSHSLNFEMKDERRKVAVKRF